MSQKYDVLLFVSRDGYFLKKAYDELSKKNPGACHKTIYLYASRSAINCTVSESLEDIKNVCNKISEDPKLDLQNFFYQQFHLNFGKKYSMSCAEALNKWGKDGLFQEIMNSMNILEESAKRRIHYQKYLSKFSFSQNDKIAIIDIVTQGTLVYGLSHLLEHDVELIAMGTSAVPNNYIPSLEKVASMLGNVNEKVNGIVYSASDFSELHLFLELLYASTDGQLWEFDDMGVPIFVENEYDENLLISVQKELMELIEKYYNPYKMPSLEFSLSCMRLLYSKYSIVSLELKQQFGFKDPYDASKQNCNLFQELG